MRMILARWMMISIHAPCTGSDSVRLSTMQASSNFNPRSLHGERQAEIPGINALLISIHAPCTGSDARTRTRRSSARQFQSTLPARGATTSTSGWATTRRISIHAPCTGSDSARNQRTPTGAISIHAPCTGSDRIRDILQSDWRISIHAPCTGSDMTGGRL